MDFASIGEGIAMGRAIGSAREAAYAWQRRAQRLEAELAEVRAELAAHQAGLLARITVLRTALETEAPRSPALTFTGRYYGDGHPERRWDAAYWDAYDAVARREGIPPARRPMTPEERSADREAQVLAEPVRETRFLGFLNRRYWFRDEEHRTRAGAERARAAAALAARAA